LCKKIDEKSIRKRGVQVKQRLRFLLIPMYFLLIFRLVCYQQAGGGGSGGGNGKYVGISGKRTTPEKEAGKGSSFKKSI
jgi:hypothetical protein